MNHYRHSSASDAKKYSNRHWLICLVFVVQILSVMAFGDKPVAKVVTTPTLPANRKIASVPPDGDGFRYTLPSSQTYRSLSPSKPAPKLIEELGSTIFQTRTAASEELLSRGETILPVLTKAQKSVSSSIAQKLDGIIREMNDPVVIELRDYYNQRARSLLKRVKSDPWATKTCTLMSGPLSTNSPRLQEIRSRAKVAHALSDNAASIEMRLKAITDVHNDLLRFHAKVDAVREPEKVVKMKSMLQELQSEISKKSRSLSEIHAQLKSHRAFVETSFRNELPAKLQSVWALSYTGKKNLNVAPAQDNAIVQLPLFSSLPDRARRTRNFPEVNVSFDNGFAPSQLKQVMFLYSTRVEIDLFERKCSPHLAEPSIYHPNAQRKTASEELTQGFFEALESAEKEATKL